jgi:hypothetical protein
MVIQFKMECVLSLSLFVVEVVSHPLLPSRFERWRSEVKNAESPSYRSLRSTFRTRPSFLIARDNHRFS